MIKRIFFGLAVFIALFTLLAWQFAVTEIEELETKHEVTVEESTVEEVG